MSKFLVSSAGLAMLQGGLVAYFMFSTCGNHYSSSPHLTLIQNILALASFKPWQYVTKELDQELVPSPIQLTKSYVDETLITKRGVQVKCCHSFTYITANKKLAVGE